MAKSAKAEQYARELDAARLRGDWTSDPPSQAAKALPWSELTRKFAKHNPERTSWGKLATVEQQLRLNLHHFYAESGYSDASHTNDFSLRTSNDSTRFPPMLKNGESGVGWSTEVVAELANSILEFKGDGEQRHAAVSLRALALFALGNDEAVIDLLHRERFMEEATAAAGEIETGNSYFVALILQGFVVYGMANERLQTTKQEPGYTPFALAGYAKAIDLHEAVRGGKRANALRGLPADEIERWGETALYRNALLSLRQGESGHSLNALRAYHAHAARWQPDFRLPQRNVVYRYYLAVLNQSAETGVYADPPAPPVRSAEDWRSKAFQQMVAATVASRVQIRDYESERVHRDPLARRRSPAFGSRRITSRTVSKRRPAVFRELRAPSVAWSNESLTIQKSAANSLLQATEFPRAGKINVAVLDFADELVRGWELNGELGGEQADDVVEILYGLVGLTFHSQRISRHLVRLLFAAEAHDEAKRALQAYIQIVDKAREADQESTSAQVTEINGESQAEASHDVAKDTDDDATYARTLAYGANAVGKYCKDYVQADKVARKGLQLVKESKHGLGPDLVALLKRVAGSARASLAAHAADPVKRPDLQKEALELLTASSQLDDQSSETFYQLGYLQAEMRDIPSAIISARKAIELEPADVDSWHLLVLLLSAQKKYKDAFKIAEIAIAEAEADDKVASSAKIGTRLDSNGSVPNGTDPYISAPAQLLSVDYPPSLSERNESILHLMLTYTALEEALDGVENASEGQKELFSFFHKAFPSAAAAAAAASASATAAQASTRPNGQANFLGVLTNGHSIRRHDSHTTLASLANGGGSVNRAATTAVSTSSRVRTFGHRDRTTSTSSKPATLPRTHVGFDSHEGHTSTTERETANSKKQTYLLARIWLTSAASFRRAGKLKQCRTAIQEAERLQPGLADVWVQLALYFSEMDQTSLAIESLYKALACSSDDVAASVHLARLFLSTPDIKPKTAHDSPAPAPRSEPQAAAMNGSQDRSISATPQADSITLGGKKSHYSSAAEASLSDKAQDLSAVSLAEGLLTSVTLGNGWDVSEAWLFLARAVQRSNRTARARTCLEYALMLENTKPIRPLGLALNR
ncbi:hypothetical protein ACQY0O_008102 [Thecaphora frezii]